MNRILEFLQKEILPCEKSLIFTKRNIVMCRIFKSFSWKIKIKILDLTVIHSIMQCKWRMRLIFIFLTEMDTFNNMVLNYKRVLNNFNQLQSTYGF